MPPGRFVCGVTATALGDVHAVGVCIPWVKAHVSTDRKDRPIWADHLAYLDGLASWLPEAPSRMVLLGDFNQRVPRKYQPQHVIDALQDALLDRLQLATAGDIPGIGKQAIDPICCSRDLAVDQVAGISSIGPNGQQLSDHFGVRVSLS